MKKNEKNYDEFLEEIKPVWRCSKLCLTVPWRFQKLIISENQDEDKKLIIAALEEEKEKHEKRLKTW